MKTKKGKRVPKPILANPLGYVLESVEPIAVNSGYISTMKIKNSMAMVALLKGWATLTDVNQLLAMCGIIEALESMGFVDTDHGVSVDGRMILLGVISRVGETNKYSLTDYEKSALNLLMTLHDSQMAVITVKDMETAVKMAISKIRNRKGV